MRYFLLFIFVGLVCCDPVKDLEVPGDNYFIKYFGDDGIQIGIDLEVDSEGNTYLLGTSDPSGATSDGKSRQLFLVKTDPKGILIWSKLLGTDYNDNARDLVLTKDNQLLVLANSLNEENNSDIYIAIVDLNGTLVKSTIFKFVNPDQTATKFNYNEFGNSITATNDGFIVAGSTDFVEPKASSVGTAESDIKDGLQVRFYSDLTEYPDTWRKKIGSEFSDVIISLIQNENGNFSMFGYTNKPLTNEASSNYKFWVRGLNSFGEALGNELLISDNKNDFVLNNVVPVSDGFLLSGQFNGSGESKIAISKLYKNLTLNGNPTITSGNLFTSLNLNDNTTKNVTLAPSSGTDFYVFSNAISGSKSYWYLDRRTISGTSNWNEPVYFTGENNNTIGSIKVLDNSKVLMLGTMAVGGKTSEFKMTLVKVNSSGKFAN